MTQKGPTRKCATRFEYLVAGCLFYGGGAALLCLAAGDLVWCALYAWELAASAAAVAPVDEGPVFIPLGPSPGVAFRFLFWLLSLSCWIGAALYFQPKISTWMCWVLRNPPGDVWSRDDDHRG
jgi:hypothetical protein